MFDARLVLTYTLCIDRERSFGVADPHTRVTASTINENRLLLHSACPFESTSVTHKLWPVKINTGSLFVL